MSCLAKLTRRILWLFVPGILLAGLMGLHAQNSTSDRFDASTYWRAPLAAQGKAPTDWTLLEKSLAPEDCGQCHKDQLEQWRTSRHARAFSPGLVGQLLTLSPQGAAECLECHAPLAEQWTAFEAARALGVAHKRDQQGLAAAGISCSGCHLREHRRYGPPQRVTNAIGPSASSASHGGVFRTAFFESSEFCSECHQFAANVAVNGKPLQNTFAEWKASPKAAQGSTCQTCHMPDRQHLWRGIHDPAMVASGITPRVSANAQRVRFEVSNTAVGHAFPTYVAAKIALRVVALDEAGTPRSETLRSYYIARQVRYDGAQWIEVSDTRLLPGQSAAIELAWNGSNQIRVWMEVIPDDFHEAEIFRERLETLPPGSDAARLITAARSQAAKSSFRLFEDDIRRP